jgi:hypothetical protein
LHAASIKAQPFFKKVAFSSALLLPFVLPSPAAAAGASLSIGNGVSIQAGAAGQLVVRDTLKAAKSTLTSGKVAPAPGDWLGLLILGSATGVEFSGTLIEFAGSGGGALEIRGVSPGLSGIEIKNNAGSGIRLSDGAAPLIRDAVVTGNAIGIRTSCEFMASESPAFSGATLLTDMGTGSAGASPLPPCEAPLTCSLTEIVAVLRSRYKKRNKFQSATLLRVSRLSYTDARI